MNIGSCTEDWQAEERSGNAQRERALKCTIMKPHSGSCIKCDARMGEREPFSMKKLSNKFYFNFCFLLLSHCTSILLSAICMRWMTNVDYCLKTSALHRVFNTYMHIDRLVKYSFRRVSTYYFFGSYAFFILRCRRTFFFFFFYRFNFIENHCRLEGVSILEKCDLMDVLF